MQYYKYDENGYWLADIWQEGGFWRDLPPLIQTVVTQDENGEDITEVIEIPQMEQYIPDGMTDVRPPDGLYLAHWDGTAWSEARPPAPTEGYDPETEQPVWDTIAKVWKIVPMPPQWAKFTPEEKDDFLVGLMEGLGYESEKGESE